MAAHDAPKEQLDPRALTLWRASEAAFGIFYLAIGGAISAGLYWRDVALVWVALPVIIAVVLAVLGAIWLPELRWRQWRYEVRDLEVDLQHGIWTRTRTLVPMARIQHVDTRRGPLQQRLGLASVVLYTAAGASEIPALSVEVAAAVRDRIGALANVRDEV